MCTEIWIAKWCFYVNNFSKVGNTVLSLRDVIGRHFDYRVWPFSEQRFSYDNALGHCNFFLHTSSMVGAESKFFILSVNLADSAMHFPPPSQTAGLANQRLSEEQSFGSISRGIQDL